MKFDLGLKRDVFQAILATKRRHLAQLTKYKDKSFDETDILDDYIASLKKDIACLMKIDFNKPHDQADEYSLVKSSRGLYVMGFSQMKFDVSGNEVVGLDPVSPLYKTINGKKAGTEFEWESRPFRLLAVV